MLKKKLNKRLSPNSVTRQSNCWKEKANRQVQERRRTKTQIPPLRQSQKLGRGSVVPASPVNQKQILQLLLLLQLVPPLFQRSQELQGSLESLVRKRWTRESLVDSVLSVARRVI